MRSEKATTCDSKLLPPSPSPPQEPIKQPMIQTRDKQLKKEAVDLFKQVLQYMGDRKSKHKDHNLVGLEIMTRAWEKKGLRDEVYIQLCRQTSGNDKP